MGYKVIGVDDSAIRTLGYAHKGAAATFEREQQGATCARVI